MLPEMEVARLVKEFDQWDGVVTERLREAFDFALTSYDFAEAEDLAEEVSAERVEWLYSILRAVRKALPGGMAA